MTKSLRWVDFDEGGKDSTGLSQDHAALQTIVECHYVSYLIVIFA